MTHTYKVTGMTCGGCQATVTRLLSAVDGVNNVAIDLGKGEAKINMNKHVATDVLQHALSHHPKYQPHRVFNFLAAAGHGVVA